MLEVVLIVFLLIVVIYLWSGKVSELMVPKPVGAMSNVNYIKLYEDFGLDANPPLFEMYGTEQTQYIKYAIRAQVRGIDINLPVGGSAGGRFIELWNVRPDNVLSSVLADNYENDIYTTPGRLRGVTGNLVLLARVKPGERIVTENLPPVKKILIVARL